MPSVARNESQKETDPTDRGEKSKISAPATESEVSVSGSLEII